MRIFIGIDSPEEKREQEWAERKRNFIAPTAILPWEWDDDWTEEELEEFLSEWPEGIRRNF